MHPLLFKLQAVKANLFSQGATEDTVRLHLKEYLQNHILSGLYNQAEFKHFIFYGGTCARKIYGLDRLSEDLDFESWQSFEVKKLADFFRDYFTRLDYKEISVSTQSSQTIDRITLKFPVLYDLQLSPHRSEGLHVKVEINRQPSGHYETVLTPIMTESFSMLIKHYGLTVLMAGKMLACLNRIHIKGKTKITIKGRDFYDLIWYMAKNIKPHSQRFNDADSSYTVKKIWELLDKKIKLIKPADLLIDLQPLFIDKNYIKSWCDNFQHFYKRYRGQYED